MTLTVHGLAARIAAGGEWALLDVQEPGPFAEGHVFHACGVPYSRLELRAPPLLPRRATPIVVTDADGGAIAQRAARQLRSLGYTDVQVLEGGNAAWAAAGHPLFQGVHVPSKAFGELVEHRLGTPSLTPQEFLALRDSGRRVLLLDGRPFDEYRLYTIPGSICCPNGELALRAGAMATGADVLVVNCAGRTRSILGAETLRRLFPGCEVYALRNGTQGWFLAGLDVERGARRRYPEVLDAAQRAAARERAEGLARRHPVPAVDGDALVAWQRDADRTTYLFDVRTAEEFAAGTLPGAVHAPGGQLLQATDLWVAVAHARIVVFDGDNLRAPVVAAWLRDMGLDAHVLSDATAQATAAPPPPAPAIDPPPTLRRSGLAGWKVVDLRDSDAFRSGHMPGARWSIRPLLARVVDRGDRIAFVADDPSVAALAAIDAREHGAEQVALLADPPATAVSPDDPPRSACIDRVAFTAGRHSGDRAAAEQYLAWEVNLVRQMGPLEWARFPPAWRDG